MDADSTRLQADLRGVIEGDVLCEDVHRQIYASDASIYQLKPAGIVRPRTVRDIASCVQYARENHLSIHPRGAGSGLAGESLGRGIILDMSRYMRRWYRLDERLIRVQAGVVLAQLNRELNKFDRLYGPDPQARSVTTMGGVLSLDASGSHWLRYGSARSTVQSLQVVTAGGQIAEFSTHSRDDEGLTGRLAGDVLNIASRHAEPLQKLRDNNVQNHGGYRLDLTVANDQVDLAKLLVGAEGTLGIIAEATVLTEPLPVHRGVSLLFFHRLEHAARGALLASRRQAVACDLMDRRLLEIARETDTRFEQLIPRDAEAMLLVEFQDDDLATLRSRLRALNDSLCRDEGLAFGSRMTVERRERDFFWLIVRRVIPRLYRLRGNTRPLPIVEDIAIAPERLPDLLIELQNVLKDHQVTATMFAHAGHGQLHMRPFLDLADPDSARVLRLLSEAIFEKVLEFGGAISGEHGAGLSRSWFLPRQYGPLWPAMIAVKRAFDPAGLLNPGKVVGLPSQGPDENLRTVTATIQIGPEERNGQEEVQPEEVAGDDVAPRLPVLQTWDAESIDMVARNCNGCARCKTLAPAERMCPVFRVLPVEEASPRAKANVLRGVLAGELAVESLATEDVKRITDLCFGCHQCRVECPASVDIPKIVNELRGQYVATNGLSLADLLLTRMERIAPLASSLGTLSNWVLRSPRWRWLLERTMGLARGRQIPSYAKSSFLRWANKKRLTRPLRKGGPKVAYFVDYYANWHDPELGEALVEVLRHNRVGVYVPPNQHSSMMPRIAAGDLKGAIRSATHNIRIFADAIRQGYQVITTEPTAALCLIHEYPNLVSGEDAQLVAANTFDACRFLWDMHLRNELSLDFRPRAVRLAYHQPCHVRAIDPGKPGQQLMSLIPGLKVQSVDQGCSGMAGMYGMKRQNYRNSIRIGWNMISGMRKANVNAASTECSACKNQIEHGSNRVSLHPIKVLAYAYGRLDRLAGIDSDVKPVGYSTRGPK
ncbi:MAG: anaerobic glycerol-3-phosphate dehydrogenase subunit C [Pirellulaceae bacterium]